jgi:Major Facilitator Superfamily
VPSSLFSSRLRRIVAAYTINRLGTWFGYVALSLAVYEHTHSAVAVAALLVSGQALPAFLVPALVARIEASSRRAELTALYLFEGLATAALAVLLWHFWLPAVLVLVLLDGTAALAASSLLRAEAARAAREELRPPAGDGQGADAPGAAVAQAGGPQAGEVRHAPPPDLNAGAEVQLAERKANAALNLAFSATFVTGPALAGVLVAAAGGPVALLIDAASFLICGAMLSDLHPHVEEMEGASVRARLRAARRHINEVAVLRLLLIAEGAALVFFAADGSIEVPYATVTLNAGDRGYGLLLAAWGAGVVLGGLAFARVVRRSLGAMLSAGTLAVGLAYVGFAVAPSLPVACLAGAVGGIGNGVQWASMLSAVQQLTPQRLHGRMMGAVESIGALCPGIGLLLGGVLVAASTPRIAFLVVGLAATAMTAAFLGLSSGIQAASSPDGAASTSPGEQPREAGAPRPLAESRPRRSGVRRPRRSTGRRT